MIRTDVISKDFHTNAGKGIKNTLFQINVEKDIVNVETCLFCVLCHLDGFLGSVFSPLIVFRGVGRVLGHMRFPLLGRVF